jgi:TnpA family transposase
MALWSPGALPRQFRLCIAEQLGGDSELAEIRTIDRRERTRILGEVRAFLAVRPATRTAKEQVEKWLIQDVARREGDVAVLTNAAIERFRQTGIELPALTAISALAQRALAAANTAIEQAVDQALSPTESAKLLSLIEGPAALFRRFKEPAGAPSPNALEAELQRLEELDAYVLGSRVQTKISKRKREELATLAKRYDASELRQLRLSKRRATLACFVAVRRAEQLDDLVDLFIGTWDNARKNAGTHAHRELTAAFEAREKHWELMRELMEAIRASRTASDLWDAVHACVDVNDEALWAAWQATPTWAGLYYAKLEDHYPSLRRFLPRWYGSMPVASTTAEDALVRAKDYLRVYALPSNLELPARGAPTEFLPRPWESRAVRRYAKTKQVVRIIKAPYELGWCEAAASAFRSGMLAVPGANRYAPMTEHLLDRHAFLADFETHVQKVGLPAVASDHYPAMRDELETKLRDFDSDYDDGKQRFWMNLDGTLGFSRVPGSAIPRRAQALSATLTAYIPDVSIIDVLLDCHRWTGFMDSFRPLSARQSMRDTEKIRHTLAALYAYGCNCGPTQAARAVGLSPNQVVYIRRHYLGTKQLIDAASRLADAYSHTAASGWLGDPDVLVSDAMHVQTPRSSLRARSYYRDMSRKSVLLYQHVTSHCICRFTQALLCNVSEAIHMLHGVLQCRHGQEPLISICDSGGKSDLVFGLASLLNILLYPRIRSRNLRLWAPAKTQPDENLPGEFAGVIRWDWLDAGWQDMIWILASIASGTAPPVVILGRLATQPNHPATRGFQELGKLKRSLYLLDYGMDMELRRFVVPHTARREHWNRFTRDVLAFGDLVREKDQEGQEEVFWFLTVVQNAIVLWNALALEKAIAAARGDGMEVRDEDLAHVTPTMIGHINFVGRFALNLGRRPPFKFSAQLP